jgi:hypothetical protein
LREGRVGVGGTGDQQGRGRGRTARRSHTNAGAVPLRARLLHDEKNNTHAHTNRKKRHREKIGREREQIRFKWRSWSRETESAHKPRSKEHSELMRVLRRWAERMHYTKPASVCLRCSIRACCVVLVRVSCACAVCASAAFVGVLTYDGELRVGITGSTGGISAQRDECQRAHQHREHTDCTPAKRHHGATVSPVTLVLTDWRSAAACVRQTDGGERRAHTQNV